MWVIRYGSLDSLVENLCSPSGEIDSSYINIFLATYRSFASPKQVINLLFARSVLSDESEYTVHTPADTCFVSWFEYFSLEHVHDSEPVSMVAVNVQVACHADVSMFYGRYKGVTIDRKIKQERKQHIFK